MWLVAMNIDIGTILTAIGVFVAIFGAWWQIYRFKTENKKNTMAIFFSSLLDFKGKIRAIFIQRPQNVAAGWMDIAIAGTNQVRNYLRDIKSKTELLNVLESSNNIMSDISMVIATGICKSKIKNQSTDEVNRLPELLFHLDIEMPLTMEIIRDCLFLISWIRLICIEGAAYNEFFDERIFLIKLKL